MRIRSNYVHVNWRDSFSAIEPVISSWQLIPHNYWSGHLSHDDLIRYLEEIENLSWRSFGWDRCTVHIRTCPYYRSRNARSPTKPLFPASYEQM